MRMKNLFLLLKVLKVSKNIQTTMLCLYPRIFKFKNLIIFFRSFYGIDLFCKSKLYKFIY